MTGLEDLVADGMVSNDVPLGPLTTYKSGGPARYFAQVEDAESLSVLVEASVPSEIPVLVLGRGSNIVVSDAGFSGLVIKLGRGFGRISVDVTSVTAGAAASLARVARTSVEAGVRGLEFFVGIPGSVGGAVRQNAGCFGTETGDRLITATVIDLREGGVTQRTPEGLELSYRHSNVASPELVIEAEFRGSTGDVEEGLAEIRRITRWRKDNQPGGTLNAGSVFKNPPHIAAGALIDSLGLKGLRVGDVEVSSKHANFFIAGPAATSADIRLLVEEVKDRVFDMSGTILEPEIQFVGFDS